MAPILVVDQTTRPEPTSYPPLLPTLQTSVGMVTYGGRPRDRGPWEPNLQSGILGGVKSRAADLRARCNIFSHARVAPGIGRAKTPAPVAKDVERNLLACAMPVTKGDLVDYISHAKRLDTEQAVAMAIAYIANTRDSNVQEKEDDFEMIDDPDTFEKPTVSLLDELINDQGVTEMLVETHMYRLEGDFELAENPREAGKERRMRKIGNLLIQASPALAPTDSFADTVKSIRRRRHGDHLILPEELLPSATTDPEGRAFWSKDWVPNSHDTDPLTNSTRVVGKRMFRRLQRILFRVYGRTDPTSTYVRQAEELVEASRRPNPRRIAALEQSNDPAAIAYGFISAQRRRQLKVVSDTGWSRFLIKGEGKFLLQNRPDFTTSFEDILIRHATDLRALTAVACPRGLRDHFSNEQDVKDRARRVCEMMERYVQLFGNGKMENLVYTRGVYGGSGRGPVDVYNALCDSLRDCKKRAQAMGFNLGIGKVYKFLAKDIMAWNDGWSDDAFAGAKVPGWLMYLARVRMEEVSLEIEAATD